MFDVKGILKDFGNFGQSRMFRTKLLALRSMLARQTDNLQASYISGKNIFLKIQNWLNYKVINVFFSILIFNYKSAKNNNFLS
jgi:hypothetical protein